MFMLFTFDRFYPGGGWNDFRGFFMTMEDAERVAKNSENDRYQIVGSVEDGTGIVSEGRVEDL